MHTLLDYFHAIVYFQDGNGLLLSVKSTDLEDSDLTCFEHSMSLPYPSGSNPAVVSHDSELIPHDLIIPDDFLATEGPDDDNDDNCSTALNLVLIIIWGKQAN